MATSSAALLLIAAGILDVGFLHVRGVAGFSISSQRAVPCVPTRTVLCVAASPSTSSSADAGSNASGSTSGSPSEVGGQLAEKQQAAEPSTAAASEYRPLQRQWWEVRQHVQRGQTCVRCACMYVRPVCAYRLQLCIHVYDQVYIFIYIISFADMNYLVHPYPHLALQII